TGWISPARIRAPPSGSRGFATDENPTGGGAAGAGRAGRRDLVAALGTLHQVRRARGRGSHVSAPAAGPAPPPAGVRSGREPARCSHACPAGERTGPPVHAPLPRAVRPALQRRALRHQARRTPRDRDRVAHRGLVLAQRARPRRERHAVRARPGARGGDRGGGRRAAPGRRDEAPGHEPAGLPNLRRGTDPGPPPRGGAGTRAARLGTLVALQDGGATFRPGTASVALDGHGNALLSIEVEVRRAGPYHAYAELWSPVAGRSLAFGRKNLGRLEPGVHRISLLFGGQILRDSGVDGPYAVRNLELLRVTRQRPHRAQPVAELMTTPPWRASDFH